MNRNDIIVGWKKRCIDAGVSLSSILESAGFDPAVATHWSSRGSSAPEAEFVARLTDHVPFSTIVSIVDGIEWPAAGRSRIIDTYVRIENAMREAEAAKTEAQ